MLFGLGVVVVRSLFLSSVVTVVLVVHLFAVHVRMKKLKPMEK